jgi:hypothetical protein
MLYGELEASMVQKVEGNRSRFERREIGQANNQPRFLSRDCLFFMRAQPNKTK